MKVTIIPMVRSVQSPKDWYWPGGVRNKRTRVDHSNYSVVEIDRNTKNSGDQSTCCHINSCGKPSANAEELLNE